ncbi:hypothetical protein FSP39_018477 [Pinctada imbricata]|uniref:Acyl-coenzyme A oxidase n=1 Tax=Pinctada imbricata TaxID=66713 RepID=A0AA89BM95_PINIB|nr:hypothetical protein FSP39_018477 [Pinctada imbricata]
MSVTTFDLALLLHTAMFIPALERLATEQQKAKWMPLAKNFKILGTYGQTEMGHGTYIQGLETTATFDPKTDEFVLNTPSISAMKFWPGSLGRSCNYSIVLAILMINGQKYGMHPFLVPLRSLQDHKPLPGIRVGNVGAKMGRNGIDNGYLILDNIRIPRLNMLMKNAQVSSDGTFTSRGPNQANYATMVLARGKICGLCYNILSKGVTIGIRYAAVRRQSKIDPNERETKILDFQTQQYKLFPALAMAYAFMFTSRSVTRKYNEIFPEIQKGDMRRLPELHSLTAGLKAFCAQNLMGELEIIRQSCGGHGYLNAAGLGFALIDATPMVTGEGEITVLYLQVARVISDVAKQVQKDIGRNIPQHFAMNNHLVDLVRAAKAHCHYMVVREFTDSLEKLEASHRTMAVLRTLCCFYAVHGIVGQSGEFLQTGAMGINQLNWIKDLEISLLGEIRPDAVPLVDAFDFHNISLSSALGCNDGNAYERLFKSSENDPMNKQELVCILLYIMLVASNKENGVNHMEQQVDNNLERNPDGKYESSKTHSKILTIDKPWKIHSKKTPTKPFFTVIPLESKETELPQNLKPNGTQVPDTKEEETTVNHVEGSRNETNDDALSSSADKPGEGVNCGPPESKAHFEWTPAVIDPQGSVAIKFNMIAPVSFNKGIVSADLAVLGQDSAILSISMDLTCEDDIKKFVSFITCPLQKDLPLKFTYDETNLTRLPTGSFNITVKIKNEKNEDFLCVYFPVELKPEEP